VLAVVPPAGFYKDGILVLGFGHEDSRKVTVSDKTVTISIELVEKDEDLIFGEIADLKVVSKDIVKVIYIETSSVVFDTVEKLVAIGDVEVLTHCEFSALAIKVTFDLHHVYKCLYEDGSQRVS